MRYTISQIKLNIDQSHEDFEKEILNNLKKKNLKIYDIEIIKESIDARRKSEIKLVYTLDFSCDEELPLKESGRKVYSLADMLPEVPEDYFGADGKISEKFAGTESNLRPVIAGFGPSGMFAGLILAEAGFKPVVIERGEDVDSRVRTVEEFWKKGVLKGESNVQFGEGGAGTFSDGKLTTGIKDIRISKVMDEFIEAGADSSIKYKQKPHIGTDKLRGIVKNIRHKIEKLGGEVRFCTRLEDIVYDNEGGVRKLKGLYILKDGSREFIETNSLILATGHSARDTFKMLHDHDIYMEQKPFSIGVRIEHPQEMINKAQYGRAELAEILGPADYKLNYKCRNGRGVYTFCMCPGGEVIDSSSETETAVTNGMSFSRRDGKFANSGLLVDVRPEDFNSEDPLAGIEFQRKYEKLAYKMGGGKLPTTDYRSFRKEKDDAVRQSLPAFASEAIIEALPFMGRKIRGFDSDDARMTAVETRSSSPVRISRNEEGQTDIRGIFPAGEGPGYAGGIMSAAVDGIRTAEKVIKVIFL